MVLYLCFQLTSFDQVGWHKLKANFAMDILSVQCTMGIHELLQNIICVLSCAYDHLSYMFLLLDSRDLKKKGCQVGFKLLAKRDVEINRELSQ